MPAFASSPQSPTRTVALLGVFIQDATIAAKGGVAMRRPAGFSIALVVVLTLSVSSASSAGAAEARRYHGKTSQGMPAGFRLVQGSRGLGLRSFGFDFALRCEDGSRLSYIVGWSFGRAYPLDGRSLSFDDASYDSAIHVTGRFGPGLASGTVRFTVAALTEDEEAQICTTGDLTWAARRVETTTSSLTTAAFAPDRTIEVHVSPDGTERVLGST
jgi:hypothetical protein